MAYLRRRGNQLAIVHGEREPGTGKVQQQILFTLYSKAEAREALGRGQEPQGAERFRRLLEREYPPSALAKTDPRLLARFDPSRSRDNETDSVRGVGSGESARWARRRSGGNQVWGSRSEGPSMRMV